MSHVAPLLPEDLIVEIMSWVPVKTLIRFRCVSKAWNSLIFNPRFVNLHFQRSPKHTHLLISYSRCNEEIWTVEDYHDLVAPCAITRLLENPSSTIDDCAHQINGSYSVIGTCKGLVSLLSFFLPVDNEIEEYWVRFYNPATRVMSQESLCLCLKSSMCDIGQNGAKFGFGYDDSSDTCKVVAIILDMKSQQREVRVHDLGDNCWKKTLTCPPFPVLGMNGVFVSGTINWLAFSNLSYNYQWENVTIINELVIFSYDLKNETCKYLLKPEGLVDVPHHEPLLDVLKGCLCLSYNHRGTHYVVWLMREFGDEKSWTQLMNVSCEHLQIDERYWIRPMCMFENEDFILLNHNCNIFSLYNKRDNRMDRIGDFTIKLRLISHNYYVQSLALPY